MRNSKSSGPKVFDFKDGVLQPVRDKRRGIIFSDSTDDIDSEKQNWGLHFAKTEYTQKFNLFNKNIADYFEKINYKKVTESTHEKLNIFLEAISETDEYLRSAREEIAYRKELRKQEAELKKGLAVEQVEDVLLTLLMTNPIDTAKNLKSKLKAAIFSQLVIAGGAPPALGDAIEAIVDLKTTLGQWKKNPMLFIDFLIDNGSGLLDAVSIAALSVKLNFFPLIPEDVAEHSEKCIAEFQAENDKKMDVVIDLLLNELKAVSEKGLLPENETERNTIQQYLNIVRKHLDDHRQRTRVRFSNEDFDKLDQLEKRVKYIEEECRKLNLWKPLLQSNTVLGRIAQSVSNIEIPGFGQLEYIGDALQGAANALDLERALYENSSIAMALHTYKILREHKKFPTVKEYAEFLVALESQHVRGLQMVEETAKKFKFVFQSSGLQDATLIANQTSLNRRKLQAAKALTTECTDSFYFEKNQEKSEKKALETVQLLEQLKGSTKNKKDSERKEDRFNSQVDVEIKRIKTNYESKFQSYKLNIENISPALARFRTDADLLVDFNSTAALGEMLKRLVAVQVFDEKNRDAFIEKLQEVKTPRLLKDGDNDKFAADLALVKRIYRSDPRASLLEVTGSDLNKMIASNVNDFISEIKEQEKDACSIAERIHQYAAHYLIKNKITLGSSLGEKFESTIKTADKGWNTITEAFCDINARKTGVPAKSEDLLAKQKEMIARASELQKRHELVEKWLSEKIHLQPSVLLSSPRTLYLADLTPYALKLLIERLDTSSDLIHNATMILNDAEKKMLLDIHHTQSEIAASLFERLLLARENKSADLVAHYYNQQENNEVLAASEAYRLSDTDICFFMEFIEKHGDAALKEEMHEKCGSASEVLRKISSPFDVAFDAYLSVQTQTKDQDSLFRASESLTKTTDWLPKYKEKASKQSYSTQVAAALSPMGIVKSGWVDHVDTQRLAHKKESDIIVGNLIPKVESLQKDIVNSKKSLENYKNSFWSKPFRYIFSGFKGKEKRELTLAAIIAKREEAELTLEKAKASLELSQQKLEKHVKQMVQHVVVQVRNEVVNQKLMAADVPLLKAFVEKHDKNALEELNRNLNFTTSFLTTICNQESVDVLKNVVDSIQACQPKYYETAQSILNLLQGKLPEGQIDISKKLVADIRSLIAIEIETSDSVIVEKLDKELLGEVYESISNGYVRPLIIEKLEKEEINKEDIEETKIQLSLFDPSARLEILKEYVKSAETASVDFSMDSDLVDVELDTQSKLLNAFRLMPAFLTADDYQKTRDHALTAYFERRIDHVFSMKSFHYDVSESTNDQIVLQAARAALLPEEAEDGMLFTAAEKILNDKVAQALLKIPAPLWNKGIATLLEDYAGESVINEYRLLRLKELSIDPQFVANRRKSETVFQKFIDSMNVDYPLEGHADFIAELISSKTPSWMNERIVREFGTQAQLQTMHANWMIGSFREILSDHHEKSDKNELVLHDLLREHVPQNDQAVLTMHDTLTSFVGIHNLSMVQVAFEQAENKWSGNIFEISPAKLTGDVNKIKVSVDIEGTSVEDRIKLGRSLILEILREVFPSAPVSKLDRLQAQRDLNVLSKAYYHVGETVGRSKTLDVAHVQNVLLITPEERQKIKEQTREMLLHGFEFLEKRPESDVEMTQVHSAVKRLLQTSENEYNYAIDPDIYYTHYLHLVQEDCEKLLTGSFTEKTFNLDNLVEIDNALRKFENEMVSPISSLDHRHVMPIIFLLNLLTYKKLDSDVVSKLQEDMLKLGQHYDVEVALNCMDFSREHSVPPDVSSAIMHFVTACKKASELRELMQCLTASVSIEAVMQESASGQKSEINLSDLFSQLDATVLEKIPSLKSRLALKLDDWIIAFEDILSKNGLSDKNSDVKLSLMIQKIGSEAQKNKFARYQTTAKLLNNIDSSPIPVENIDYDIDLFKKGMLANLSRMPKGGDAATVRSIAEFTTRNSERNDEFYNSVSDSVTAMVNALPNDPQIVLNFLSNPGCLALVRSEGVAEKMLSLVVKLMTDSSYDLSLVQAFTKLGSKSHSALKMMLDEKAMYRFIDKVIEDYKKNLIEKGVPASENDMKKRWAFVESFATEEQKIKFATYRHAERLLSRVDANSDILLLPILEADSDYDKEILQKAMLTRLQSAQKNDLTNHYALARLVPEIKIIAEFTQVSKDQEFSNSVSEHITGIIENLMILANKNFTSSRAINAGDSDQYRKLLIALLGNDFVISLANKELIRAALFELKNKNSEVVKACVPVLFGRIDEMLSDLGFAEYKAEVESRAMKQVSNVTMGHMHIRGAMISMPASTHTSLSPQLREMCGLISQFGSESDKKELANKLDLLRVHATTDYPGNDQAKKTYYVLMQKAAVEHLASLAKKLNSSSPGGFFDDKERVEDQRKLAKLKVAYEGFATGFFKGISKIFTKKQTYEGAIKVMQEKVLDRVQAGKAPDGASYDTLDEVKRLPDGVPGKGFKKEFQR